MCSNVQQILKLLQKQEPPEANLQFIKRFLKWLAQVLAAMLNLFLVLTYVETLLIQSPLVGRITASTIQLTSSKLPNFEAWERGIVWHRKRAWLNCTECGAWLIEKSLKEPKLAYFIHCIQFTVLALCSRAYTLCFGRVPEQLPYFPQRRAHLWWLHI